MIALPDRVARQAEALVGTPFRLQGRDTRTGIDCVGLVLLALQRAQWAESIPALGTYRLRNRSVDRLLPFAELAGLVPTDGSIERGDILHTAPGAAQDHLLVAAGANSFVHAHAGLRRVVLSRGPLCDRVLHHWRPA